MTAPIIIIVIIIVTLAGSSSRWWVSVHGTGWCRCCSVNMSWT